MINSIRRCGGVAAGIAAFVPIARGQTSMQAGAAPGLNPVPLQRIDIESFGRVDDTVFFAEPVDASGGAGSARLCWDNGARDDITAHLSQRTSIGDFLAADDFFIKEGLFQFVDQVTFCFAVSDTIDGVMTKPVFELVIYDDCNGRPGTPTHVIIDPDRIATVFGGPSVFAGFNLWFATFDVREFFEGYRRPWLSPRGIGDVQDGLYYWISANNGTIQGAQAQLKNGAEPWIDVQDCDCPGICTDLYFFFTCDRCCLMKNNMPFDPTSGSKSLQLKGATIDTARAVDNFQIPPDNFVDLCRVEAWMATNCPLDKVFLEVYENDCDCPGAKVCTIDIEGFPLAEDTGADFLNCNVYHLVWPQITGAELEPGRDYWLAVVARGTGSILDKAFWMHKATDDCHINITEGKVKDPFIPGLEEFTFVSSATLGPPRDFGFKIFTSDLIEERGSHGGTPSGGNEPVSTPLQGSQNLGRPLAR